MDFKFRFMEQIVGAFLFFTVIFIIVAVVLVGQVQDWFKKERYTYFIRIDQGYGLKEGSSVKMKNSEIGKVISMGMDKDDPLRWLVIKIAVWKETDMIRGDSRVSVESEGFIGGSFIAVTPGSNEAEKRKDGSIFEAPPKKTISDYIEELQLEEKIRIITQIINDLGEITNRLKNPNEGILAALDNINAITEKIRMGEGTIGKVLVEETLFNQISAQINHLDTMMSNFKQSSTDVNQMTERLPDIMNEIETGIQQIRNMLAELEKASRDVPEISRKATEGVDSALEIVDSIKENPIIKMGTPKQAPPERQLEIQQRGE